MDFDDLEYDVKLGVSDGEYYSISRRNPSFVYRSGNLADVLKRTAVAIIQYDAFIRTHPSILQH